MSVSDVGSDEKMKSAVELLFQLTALPQNSDTQFVHLAE